jgi:hemolysin III
MSGGNLVFWGLRDPISSLTHLAGAVLAIPVTVALWRLCRGDRVRQWGMAVFGTSLFVLYAASGTYHALRLPRADLRFFQLLDHSAIYGLIAGTYTPAYLVLLRPRPSKYLLLGGIWLLAAVGIACKWMLPMTPYGLTVALYVGLGWVALFSVVELFGAVGVTGLAWALGGGLLYTLGALCDYFAWPVLVPGVFGGHEMLHVLDLCGSCCHVYFMAHYVVPFNGSRAAEVVSSGTTGRVESKRSHKSVATT